MKRKLLLAALCVVGAIGGGNSLMAQTAWSGDITNADGLTFATKYADPSNHDVAETWTNTSSTTHAFDVNQSLTSIPDGVYELSAQAMYRASLTYGTSTNCVLYATVGDKTYSTPIANFGDFTAKEDRAQIGTQMQNNNAYLNVVPAVIVEGGNATIGMKSVGELAYCTNGYWFVYKKSTFTFKNVTDTYHAKLITRANTILVSAPESDAKTTLSNAVTTYATANLANVKALQTAINTFLETATVENPLNVTDYITNPSFEDNSGNKKNWIQDLGYKQPSEIYQPTGWNMTYSSLGSDGKVNNTQFQTYKTQTDGAKDGYCYYVRHRWNDVCAVVSLHQLVKELPAGVYSLTVAVKGGSSVTDANTLTMTSGDNTNTTGVNNFDKSNYKDYTVSVTKEDANADLDICYGWNQQRTNAEQLYYVDDFRLYYLGDPVKAKKAELEALQATITDEAYFNNASYANVVGTERMDLTTAKTQTAAEETVAAYETAISKVQAAIDAFTAAKSNYDALVAEIDKAKALGIDATTADGYAATNSSTATTALTSTQDLKVAEYNYVTDTYQYGVDLGTWTTTGDETADNKGEHWDGTSTSTYKEQKNSWGTPKKGYAADSWAIGFSQTLNLPAGNYVFKVAGRQSSGACTMALNVKKGDEVLGTVNDFPRSNTGKGIDTNGATNFGDGTYANNNNGRGWEWRYVKFELSETADVTISIDAQASAASQWISFANYTVQTDNDANISLIAYNIALNDANAALSNTDYTNVTGEEKVALENAIAIDKGSTKESIDAATTALTTATSAFTAAKESYDKLVVAKAQFNDADYTQELYPYATDEKFDAIAKAKAMEEGNATKNGAKADAMITAYRTFVESNAKAEKSATAVDKTSVIENANAQQGDENAITVGQAFGWTKGTGMSRKGDQPFTDANNQSGSNYFDYWSADAWEKKITQKVNIPAGKYILTATTRASDNLTKFNLIAGDASAEMKHINADVNTGTFNRGWNDNYVVFTMEKEGQVEIGIDAAGPANTWMSFDRFRLAQISQEITMTSSANLECYKTFYNADVNYEVDNNTTIYVAETPNAGASYVTLNAVEGNIVPKGTPVILKTSDTKNYTITLTPTEEEVTISDNALQVASAAGAVANAYILGYLDQKGEGLGFYRYEPSLDKGDIYLVVPATTAANVRLGIIADGEATGIESVNAEAGKANDAIYNMAGQRVGNGYKGIVIKNGKKILVK